ncbi:MAG: TolC family protein [Bacteroidetes bacterium]|nr:TolC family protein [Bacteroidota bacterium]
MIDPSILRNASLYIIKVICFLIISPYIVIAQQQKNDSTLSNATLENCISYAMVHNPELQNAHINENITESIIKGKLADWYPQINFSYNLQHNFQLPTSNFNGNYTRAGTYNTSGLNLGVTQNIFSKDVLLASRSADDVRLSSSENTKSQRINLAVSVSKAFYNLLLNKQQLAVIEQDIIRINQSYKDAYYQYQAGIVDKTDYQRASIALNNAIAQKKSSEAALVSNDASLKALMGYPHLENLDLQYDTSKIENEIYLDTLQNVNYRNRIEIQQLETQKKLQQYNLQYYKWSYLPDISAFGSYNLNFLNDDFSKLYSNHFPNSYAGITLSLPIFQGGKRVQQIKEAEFQVNLVDNHIRNQENIIQSEYQDALATYKSNLYFFYSLKENLLLANSVYDVIRLQYRLGVKAYLDVITAESDLREAQINYYNALYQLLSSKVDVEKSLGNITY